MGIFQVLELLKIHNSSFKKSLKPVFYQNISKTIPKVQILTNIQKSPSRFCHPLRLLCRILFCNIVFMRRDQVLSNHQISSAAWLYYKVLCAEKRPIYFGREEKRYQDRSQVQDFCWDLKLPELFSYLLSTEKNAGNFRNLQKSQT